MKPLKRYFCSISLFALLGLILLSVGGCANKKTAIFSKPVTGYRTVLYAAWNPTKKVCVLPFDNLSKESDANLKVMEIFLTKLFSAEIFEDIIDPVQANAALLGLRIRKPDSLDIETIKALGEKLNVQYLILGTVTDYSYGRDKSSVSQVGLNVRMIDVSTGTILWTGNGYKDGSASWGRIFGFTDGPNPAELSNEVSLNIVNSLIDKISEGSNDRGFFGKAQEPANQKVVVDDSSSTGAEKEKIR